MTNVGTEPIASVFAGEQPIKTIMAGTDCVYDRPGGYVYINLITDPTQFFEFQNGRSQLNNG